MNELTAAAGGKNSRRLPFTSNFIKLAAVISMICDHFCVAFITTEMHPLRWIGRIGFPVFAFQIARGAALTRNSKKYLLRLLLFAPISEIPFDLMVYGKTFDPSGQNVFFTLAAGLLSIMILQALQKKGKGWPFLSLLPLSAITAVCILLRTDYSAGGALAIFLFYLAGQVKEKPALHVLLLVAGVLAPCVSYSYIRHILIWNSNEIGALFSLPLLVLYNGERGKVHINKYLFYTFYPAHLLLFGLVKIFFFS